MILNRDASCLLSSEYSVTIEECVNALYKAKWYRFFDFSDFDVEEYEKYEVRSRRLFVLYIGGFFFKMNFIL